VVDPRNIGAIRTKIDMLGIVGPYVHRLADLCHNRRGQSSGRNEERDMGRNECPQSPQGGIFRPEFIAPLGDTMCFVYDKGCNFSGELRGAKELPEAIMHEAHVGRRKYNQPSS
jgi:hypothetical protein